MVNMIDRTCISETFGDCTALYNVYFDKHCTVEEFIHEVFKKYKDEWGYFIVSAIPDSNFFYSSSDCDICEYHHGEITKDFSSPGTLNAHIVRIQGHGGWTCMDYKILISED